jgi:large subunit ribosomal protein L21
MKEFAIIQVGGKQHRVQPNDLIDVNIPKPSRKQLMIKEVLLIATRNKALIGRPFLKQAKVTCEVVGEKKGPKITIVKFKRRKNYEKKTGHRQKLCTLKVISINKSEPKSKGEHNGS